MTGGGSPPRQSSSSPTRRGGLFALLLLLACGAGWWLWPDAPSAPTAPEPSPGRPLVVSAALPSGPAQAPRVSAADAGPSVFLRVVSAVDERPLAGAKVAVQRHHRFVHHPSPPVGLGVTDAEGFVRFEPSDQEDLQVSVRLPYFENHFGPFVPHTTVALQPLTPVRGIVLSSRRSPVAGARITTQEAPVLQTTSGADGRFTLALATWGVVAAEKDGALGVAVPLDPKNAGSEVEIVLGAAPKGSARVRGRDGVALEGVEVGLRCGAITQHQLTGGDGAWTFPLLEDLLCTVTFHKPGYVPVEVSGSFGRPWKDSVLSRGARLEGRVINPDGTPLAGAEMEIAGMSPSLRPPPVTTDDQGHFAFARLGFEQVLLWATLGERTTSVEVALPDGQRREVTVVLPPELIRVPLQVLNADDTVVDAFSAVATPVPEQGWVSRSEYGEVALCRGRFRIGVTADDGRTGELIVEVDPRPEMEPLLVKLPGKGPLHEDGEPRVEHVLQVRVRTPGGAPVEGASVSCLAGDGLTEEDLTGSDGTTTCRAHTTEEDWPLHVIATLGTAKGLTRATGKEPMVEVTLRPTRTLRGRILGQLPPAGLGVLYRSATQNGDVELKGNSFTIEGVDPVRTFVCVRHEEPPAPWEMIGCAVAENSDEVVITVGAPGHVELTVLDETGQPLEAPVFYVDRQRQEDAPALKGEARLEASPGTHVLVINVEGRRARYETFVTVRAGEVTRLGTVKLQ